MDTEKLDDTLGFTHKFLTHATAHFWLNTSWQSYPPVLAAFWVFLHPQAARGYHCPAHHHASHRGKWEAGVLALNLRASWVCAKERFDRPAWPDCRLRTVRAVIRTCPVLENQAVRQRGSAPDTPAHAALLPPEDSHGRGHTTDVDTSGHEQFPPQLEVKTALSSSSNWLRELHRCVGKGFWSWLLASAMQGPGAQLKDFCHGEGGD